MSSGGDKDCHIKVHEVTKDYAVPRLATINTDAQGDGSDPGAWEAVTRLSRTS
jgi:hypothetical protein